MQYVHSFAKAKAFHRISPLTKHQWEQWEYFIDFRSHFNFPKHHQQNGNNSTSTRTKLEHNNFVGR